MTGQMLELKGLVLDSAPSIGTFESMFDGLVYQIRGKYCELNRLIFFFPICTRSFFKGK